MLSTSILSQLNRRLRWRPTWRELRFWPLRILPWIPAVIFFNDHVGDIAWINGPSMYPFLNPSFNEDLSRDLCWNSKLNPTQNLKRGMIISYQSPAHPDVQVVKRIIAMEGDIVYTRTPCPVPTVQVPANHVWVEGDNRDSTKTLDSNTYGPIPLNLITGRATHFLWPWRRIGPIRWEEFEGRTRVINGRKDDVPGWD
ncbi:peptidase S24/S26A/S26B/S26C [Leptodontidium sp. 2 PMI_412]|nr:peptidase S24/S26A/S26B/S26C [Leptodontidium sp. MPI-SDFR-AT-0119]KAH9212251.1 peptidase S24/S26A/S26B/S26C [Leptodontidium sp. 2 PMI_412]